VVKAFSPAPDVVSVHIRAEPEQVAELLPHAEDPKTLFQKLADWFNNNN
jgi:16S rRNA A1518/A1519 N6-dimethyltransferase RsmA/KsgA/DIM1 with predicted DNA glycosylase/AP lyase activity